MDNRDPKILIDEAIAAARAQGLDLTLEAFEPRTGERSMDARLKWRAGNETVLLLAEVRRGLRPAMLGALLNQMAHLGNDALLITDYVSPPLADKLRQHGAAFIDTAGNAYLNRPPALVWVKGQRPAEKPSAPTAGRAFQAAGLQMVFALLCRPEWVSLPYREIATLAGVAHGTVGNVMDDLIAAGYVVELERTNRRLRNIHRLLDTWVEAYARTLRPKQLLGRYRAPNRDWWLGLDTGKYQTQFGGEPAAAQLDNDLRPGVVTLYARQIPNRLLVDMRLRTDPAGEVEIRQHFWRFDLPDTPPALVPPLLIYADLLATGDARCFEAAKRIRERELAGLLEQA